MAESDHRSYRDPAARSAHTTPRAQDDDPLAELARLIGQNLPMNELPRDARRVPASRTEFDQPQQQDYAAAPEELPPETHAEQYAAAEHAGYEQDADPRDEIRDDGRYEQSLHVEPARRSRFPWRRREEPQLERADPPMTSADAGYDEYDDQTNDYADDHAYGEDYEEEANTRRRSGFIFVAAVFGLALLGTAGAFAYRAMFGDSALPSLPPIIKAESGPNKIIPNNSAAQGNASAADATADHSSSSERLVSREEQPVDMPPPATNAPRPVATVPIFPDPSPVPGPGTTSVFPPVPMAQAPHPPAAGDLPQPAPPAPTPAPSANATAAPAAPAATPAAPPGPAPAPKKIHTVSIRTDQSGADSATQQQGKPSGASEGSAPLSIVPSSSDAVPPAAAAHPRSVPARPAPANKPTAPATTETASVAPAASGEGYVVQVSSQHSEEDAQSSYRALQAKYPNVLGGHEPIVRRADLGAKGIYYRAMVGPFGSADQATEFCSNLKAAGGSCLVQKN